MKINRMLLVAGVSALMGAATPAQASWWCWFGCPGGSSGGNSSSSGGGSSGGGSSGGATPVPEPEQMGLFAMGVAVVGYRMLRGARTKK